jgi:hypothetical protein
MAPPIATPTPRRSSKAAKSGFSILADRLDCIFFGQLKQTSQPTVEGVAHTTRRHLTTAFTGAVNSKGATPTSTKPFATPLPSDNSKTPRIVSARCSSLTSTDHDAHCERLDEHLVPFSSTLRGSRRLRIIDVLQLTVGTQFTIVIPSEARPKEPALTQRAGLLNLFQSAIRESLPRAFSIAEKDDYVEHDMSLRAIERKGRLYHEFNVSLVSYAERHRLDDPLLPESEVDHLLRPHLRAGLLVRLDGYATRSTGIMLQFLAIPHI